MPAPSRGSTGDVYPAWSDPNLRSIAQQVRSGLFLAHVRASTGTATSCNNCHAFVQGAWAFMNNGRIGGFEQFRRHAEPLFSDALYPHRRLRWGWRWHFRSRCRSSAAARRTCEITPFLPMQARDNLRISA